MSYQKIDIIGNLGSDPVMKFQPDGTAVTNFSVATNRVWYQDEQRQEETLWFRVAVWGKRAETVNQYLSKGSKVFCSGRMNAPRVYESDGEHKCSLELTASNVVFLDSKPKEETEVDF